MQALSGIVRDISQAAIPGAPRLKNVVRKGVRSESSEKVDAVVGWGSLASRLKLQTADFDRGQMLLSSLDSLPMLASMLFLLAWAIRRIPTHPSILGPIFVFAHALIDYPFQKPAIAALAIVLLASAQPLSNRHRRLQPERQ